MAYVSIDIASMYNLVDYAQVQYPRKPYVPISCHSLSLNDIQVGRFHGILQKNSASSVTQQWVVHCRLAVYRPMLNPRRVHSARRNRWTNLRCAIAIVCHAKRSRKDAVQFLFSVTSQLLVVLSSFPSLFNSFPYSVSILPLSKITNPPIDRPC